MIIIQSEFVSYCQGDCSFIFEAYNPHKFVRQHGFRQNLPGSPGKLDIIPNVGDMYRVWLSLTRTISIFIFHISKYINDTHQNVDVKYQDWWNNQVLPILTKV